MAEIAKGDPAAAYLRGLREQFERARPASDQPPFGVTGRRRGEWSPLGDGDEVLGRVLRTQTDVKPVFVSVGHRISLDEATEITLGLCRRYRLPETTRGADHLSREVLRCLATSAEGSRDDLARPRPKIHRSVEARINPSSDDTVDVAGGGAPIASEHDRVGRTKSAQALRAARRRRRRLFHR